MSEKTKWILRKKNDENEFKENLIKTFEMSHLGAEILISRGCESIEEAQTYLNPDIKDLYDPFLLLDMQKVVDRLLNARDSEEKICLYGDYDADGTTGVSILFKFMKKHGFLVEYYIPNRLITGYGLHITPLTELIDSGVQLILTVDNGISAKDPIDFCNEKGVDVIVTDHHECHGDLPNAYGIINPKRLGSLYPFSELCGAGVVFKLMQALAIGMQIEEDFKESLECLALATVADLVPLQNENRTLVSLGLQAINAGPTNLGLKALIEVSELKTLKAWHFGFVLGPKINAAGRLGEAGKIIELLTGDEPEKLMEIAVFLSNENKKRQTLEQEILEEALLKIEEDQLWEDDLLVLGKEGWHSGVIGIVASRIQEKHFRPVIVIGIENGLGKGSCRSIEGFNIFEALSDCGDLFDSFGGHALAAGFSMDAEKIPLLRKRLNDYGKAVNLKDCFVKKLYYDGELKSEEVTWKNLAELEAFEPCGIGNPAPQFIMKHPMIKTAGKMGKDQHHLFIKFQEFRGIAFGMADFLTEFSEIKKEGYHPISLLCRLGENEFQGRKSLQLGIKGLKKNPLWDLKEAMILVKLLVKEDSPKEKLEEMLGGLPFEILNLNRDLLKQIYLFLKKQGEQGFPLLNLEKINRECSLYHLLFSCEVLREAGLIAYAIKNNSIFSKIVKTDEKKDIQKGKLMIKLKEILSIQEENKDESKRKNRDF